MTQIRDCHDYYSLILDDELSMWPPYRPKSSCLLYAAARNNLNNLQELLDSPKWYRVADKFGRTLLHVAVKMYRIEVFNYLVSLEDYPLNAVNDKKETALMTYLGFFKQECDYFPETLIKRGVNLNIQNYRGETALHIICRRRPDKIEIITMLLYYGADPSIVNHDGRSAFEVFVSSVQNGWTFDICFTAEHLFYLTYHELERCKIDFTILIILACSNPPLFHTVYRHVKDVHFTGVSTSNEDLCRKILQMELKYLKLLAEKFEDVVGEILLTCCFFTEDHEIDRTRLENIEFLLESNLKSEMIEALSTASITPFVRRCVATTDEKTLTEKLCFLLSYGMKVSTEDLEIVHSKFHQCELFRMLLYMDLDEGHGNDFEFTRLYYDVTMDLESFSPPASFKLTSYHTDQLLGLCVHETMKDYCCSSGDEEVAKKVKNLPQVPSLVEFARNVFRKYFIQKMGMTSARQFYTLVKSLPVSAVYKDIITYEKRIY